MSSSAGLKAARKHGPIDFITRKGIEEGGNAKRNRGNRSKYIPDDVGAGRHPAVKHCNLSASEGISAQSGSLDIPVRPASERRSVKPILTTYVWL